MKKGTSTTINPVRSRNASLINCQFRWKHTRDTHKSKLRKKRQQNVFQCAAAYSVKCIRLAVIPGTESSPRIEIARSRRSCGDKHLPFSCWCCCCCNAYRIPKALLFFLFAQLYCSTREFCNYVFEFTLKNPFFHAHFCTQLHGKLFFFSLSFLLYQEMLFSV